jgi:hypothetical protein
MSKDGGLLTQAYRCAMLLVESSLSFFEKASRLETCCLVVGPRAVFTLKWVAVFSSDVSFPSRKRSSAACIFRSSKMPSSEIF